MKAWPIRLRLTASFALAMLVLLTAAAAFVYARVRSDLGDSVATTLRARADAAAAHAGSPPTENLASGDSFLEAEEGFAQILSPSGRLLDAAGGTRRAALDVREARRAATGTLSFDRRIKGIEGRARVLARPASSTPGSPVVVVGQSLEDRDETLAGVLTAFAVGGAIAIAAASLVGYLLASAGLAPVEAMRRRATEVSLESDETLPLPAANDEIRRLGQTLNQMLDRLRGSFERERAFVADASHELRTPVAVLKAEIEAALRSGSYGPEVGESLAAALEECDHLAQLAEDLLVLARAGERGVPVAPERIPADRLLDAVRERFLLRAQQHGRTISVEAQGGLTVMADPLRIRQALGNLVDNALRHGEGEVSLRASRADGSVELAVEDAGPGIPPELAEAAFDRFTRGDTARTRGGAGLGLAIVQSIAEAHGGDAEISRAGDRTVARIRLAAD